MSIFADNYTVDENTGEAKLVKHLNKFRIDRKTCKQKVGHWNKNGHAKIVNRYWSNGDKKKKFKIMKDVLLNIDNPEI